MPFIGKQPSRGLVGSADIDDNAVTLAKMAHQDDGSIITYGTDTAPVLLAPDTSGEVLTTKGAGALPAFDAVSAGLSFISSTDISSAATYDFISGFDASSFDGYGFFLQNIIPVTDAVHFYARTSSDATNFDAGVSDYKWVQNRWGAYVADQADAQIALTGTGSTGYTVGSAAGESGCNGWIWLIGPHLTKQTHLLWHLSVQVDDATAPQMHGSGIRLSAADVDGFRLLFSSGSIESGSINAFGIASA